MYRRSMFLFLSAVAIVVAAFWITDNWVLRGVTLALALATAWRSLGDYEQAFVEAAGRARSGEASRDDERILGDLGTAACALVYAGGCSGCRRDLPASGPAEPRLREATGTRADGCA